MFAPEEDVKASVTLLMKQLGSTDARDHRPSASYSPPYFIDVQTLKEITTVWAADRNDV